MVQSFCAGRGEVPEPYQFLKLILRQLLPSATDR